MDEEKLGRAIGAGMAMAQEKGMERMLGGESLPSMMRVGFFVEIPPSKMAELLRARAKEIRAECAEARRLSLNDVALQRRRDAMMRGPYNRTIDLEEIRRSVENQIVDREREGERLDFLADHVAPGDQPYRMTPIELQSTLLETPHHHSLVMQTMANVGHGG